MPSEYEDKYLLLRDENTALKKKKNEQEATIKRMYTKLAIIEEKLAKRRPSEAGNNQDDPATGGSKAAVLPVRRDLDSEKFITALKGENNALRKKNQMLVEKNRWLQEKCRQSGVGKRLGGAVLSARPALQKKQAARSEEHTHTGFTGSTLGNQIENARKLHRDTFSGDLETALKKRLIIAEKQLVKLQKENEQLRSDATRPPMKPKRGNNDEGVLSDDEDEEKSAKDPTNLEIGQLKRELRDRQAQLAILNARYENLESNALAEREIQEKTLEQMEQMNRQVHKLRTQLQDTSMEKEELEVRLLKAGDQEKDITLLREQNRRLEERMTALCESPFINDAFQRKERIDKLFALEKQTQEQKKTIAEMDEENQKLQAVIRELQSTIKQLKHAKDRVEQDLAQMAHHLMEERNARSLEAIKSTTGRVPTFLPQPEPLAFACPRTPEPQHKLPEKRDACSSPVHNNKSPGKGPVSSFNVGGGVVTRKYENLPAAGIFLDAEENNNVKHLRNRVHVLQIAHLKAMQELERCEKMLQAQTNINRELALEIEELTTAKISRSNQFQRHIKDLELLCEERQQRINTLQAEVRQLKYAREKMLLKMREAGDECSEDSASDSDDSDVASLSESLILAASDLAPGEQLLEMAVISANFDNRVVGTNSSTFVLCDFYDFESQSTPLLMGSSPHYNLSAMFKVTVDGFFLRYLASESVFLEVHQASRGDFRLIGKASIRLSKLLQSKGAVKAPMLAVKSLCNNSDGPNVLGTLNVILRLSTPISEIWQVHLRSYPQDIRLLSMPGKLNDSDVVTDALCGEGGHEGFTNELQITVFACKNLRSYGKQADDSLSRAPSSYTHYQLLGFPDVFTNIVPESANPEYDLSCSRQAFPLEVDASLLRFFSQFRLWVTVFDDQVELDENSKEDGMIGRCGLTLSDLVNGDTIRGWFPLKDQSDRYAGDISILIQWKDPFQVLQLTSSQRARGVNGRPIDMHCLDFDQQHAILSMFSSDMDGRVNYRQFLYYGLPPEELELLTAKVKERFEYALDSELLVSVQDALVAATDPGERKSRTISIKTMTEVGEKYGIFLSDAERELLISSFGVADDTANHLSSARDSDNTRGSSDKRLALNYLLLHINPRLSCTERLLCHKIRQRLRVYAQEQRKRKAADAVPAPKIFEKFDETKCGRVTRSAFRKCLSALGFDLMNIESEYRELVRSHTKQGPSGSAQSDVIASATVAYPQGRIDLDEEILKAAASSDNQERKQQAVADQPKTKTENLDKDVARAAPACAAKAIPATTEFQRRKQAFMERMKAIATASSKNLVYEQVESKLQDQRMQAKDRVLSQQERLVQQVQQLHLPRNIHQDAARTLQRRYRYYKEQQKCKVSRVTTAILEADRQLQSVLRKWTFDDLNRLEDDILAEIERDVPEVKQTMVLTKKQLSYFLSKLPRIALPPELLWNLMDYFTVKETGMVAYRSLVNFIFSTATEESERGMNQRLSVLRRLFFDVGYASYVFASAGDMKDVGRISFKKYHECLSRLGAQLSPKELHLVSILFDANGYEILYLALLQILTQLPHCKELAEVLGRCHDFGISLLRDKILTFVNSDDGCLTQDELLRVLMHLGSENQCFEPKDASLLFCMIARNDDTTRISIEDLCLRLQAAAKYAGKALPEEWNKYDMHYLQRLAWNCRKFICGSYSDLKFEFERFDWQEKGFISLAEFIAGARRNGFLLFTDDQLKGIAKAFSVKTNGPFGINYRRFLDWTTPPPPVDMDVVEGKLRKCAQEQADKLPSKQLSDVFANWNKILTTETESTSDGVISRANFVKVCNLRLGLPLDENEIRTLLYTYDPHLSDQIDCGAFLRMNWREAATTSRNRAEVVSNIANVKTLVDKISQKLQAQNDVSTEIANAFSYDDNCDEVVECGQFLLAMRKLGILLSPDDVQSLFDAFGEQPTKRKMNFVKFFKSSCGLPVHKYETYELSSEHEQRLKCAMEAAVKYSLPKIQQSFEQFREFCVLHHFGDIGPAKLWRQMESSGLVDLVSKRVAGLLSQKFSTVVYDADGDSSLSVSLKAVHTYLKHFLKDAPAQPARKGDDTAEPSQLATAIASKPTRTPIAILSDFLVLCEECGVDLRGELEAHDRAYTGFVTAMELKETLLRLDIGKSTSPSFAEAVIGQLVRIFRSSEQADAVNYTAMLCEAINMSAGSDSRRYDQTTENLRARIRLKVGLAGQIDHANDGIYAQLDAAFSHFDREKKGFLTVESFCSGLQALNYTLAPDQLSTLLLNMCIFRHNGGGISRTEFDSFVLDPYGHHLLKKLSDRLYSEEDPQSQGTMPRVAYLSRLLMECGGYSHQSNLSNETFWAQLERALGRQLTTLEKHRLQHLFDVRRDDHIAYKLFLKVMSQWRSPITIKAAVVLPQNKRGKSSETREASVVDQRAETKKEKQSRLQERSTDNKPPCPCDAILRSLHNQMSSIDFDSQLDIVEEYLRLKDHKHTGSIKMKQLKRVFDQIGLSLSPDAFTSLQMYFPGITSSAENDEQDQLVAYGKLLLALEKHHQEE